MSDFAKLVMSDGRERMGRSIEVMKDELRAIRTGRATPALIEGVQVDYYGSPTPLQQLAQISVPEPRGMVVKPYDTGSIGEIEKAILKSDLGITPQNDGKLIRLTFPPLSEEQRGKLAGRVKSIAEQTRVSLRNIRRDLNKTVDGEEKDKESTLSEDQARDLREQIQELLKEQEAQVTDLADRKEKEILEI